MAGITEAWLVEGKSMWEIPRTQLNSFCVYIRILRIYIVCLIVYQVEGEEEGLMKYQYSRNDGKAYQTARGKWTNDPQWPHTLTTAGHVNRWTSCHNASLQLSQRGTLSQLWTAVGLLFVGWCDFRSCCVACPLGLSFVNSGFWFYISIECWCTESECMMHWYFTHGFLLPEKQLHDWSHYASLKATKVV